MLKKFVIGGLLLASSAAFAASPGYRMIEIANIGGGSVDASGNASFTLEYSLQPCAQTFVNYVTAEAAPLPGVATPGTAKYLAIGVLVKDSGLECMGPTEIKNDAYQVPNAPAGGVVLYPIQTR